MEKIRHTKNELKKQKDALRRYSRYLPTLTLKKQQLQAELIKIAHAMEELEAKMEEWRRSRYEWAAVFAEDIKIETLIKVEKIETSTGNIAGIDIPVFDRVIFSESPYDYMALPLWVDYGLEAVKELIAFNALRKVLEEEVRIVKEELRITTQRVNLFEKVKIPEAVENIRKIRIFLGDLETAAVATGKFAKKKIEMEVRAL